jgi:glucose-6-phosphate 1-dehydrogenase
MTGLHPSVARVTDRIIERSKPTRQRYLDLIDCDQTLFVRRDEVEAQWAWIDAIREQWTKEGLEPRPYSAGSWGPSAAIALAERDGVSWHE